MSRISLASVFLLLLGFLSPFYIQATPLEPDDEDDVEIVVVPEEGESADPPRSPSATRIDVWYSRATCSVFARLSNAGSVVFAEFSNDFTGEYHSFEVSGSGLAIMPIGDSSGQWVARFTLSSGVVYSGTFVL